MKYTEEEMKAVEDLRKTAIKATKEITKKLEEKDEIYKMSEEIDKICKELEWI